MCLSAYIIETEGLAPNYTAQWLLFELLNPEVDRAEAGDLASPEWDRAPYRLSVRIHRAAARLDSVSESSDSARP